MRALNVLCRYFLIYSCLQVVTEAKGFKEKSTTNHFIVEEEAGIGCEDCFELWTPLLIPQDIAQTHLEAQL